MSTPHLMVWLPVTLVQVFTASMFDSARIHGTEDRIPNERVRKATVDGDADLSGGKRLVRNIDSGHTDGCPIVRASHLDLPGCGGGLRRREPLQQPRRENMIVDAAGAVGRLSTLGLEAAALRTAEVVAEGRRLVGIGLLLTVAAIQMVFFCDDPVHFDVEAMRILGEWKIGGVVVCRIR